MKIITTRRISQIFFFLMFCWFCVVTTLGETWWQLRGWPINWFLQLDPLVAIGTILTTHKLYAPLLWALVTIVLTIILGRFFCSWVCPFGSLHHFVSFLGSRKKTTPQKIQLNKYRKAQGIKYFILITFLSMAAFPSVSATLQIGLLDPISFITRAFNLILLPVLDRSVNVISASDRFYEYSWLILAVFLSALFLNLIIPRFYCRFICPLGALFAILSRFAILRIGRKEGKCGNCRACEAYCQGGCEPASVIKISECVLCFNCRQDCHTKVIRYQPRRSISGEITSPNISRRGFMLSLVGGIFAVPAVRLSGKLADNWHYKTIRPPGALAEDEFLKRCIKCGQCMRLCPTNVIQPAGIEGGLENLWTPVLNNRIGTSGCQLNCTACGQICPTSAIRPITLAEKLGKDQFASTGPIKIGTAFVDRPRCLPWAMDKPCIVCQENCPLSPKAIYTRQYFHTVREGILTVKKVTGNIIEVAEQTLSPDKFAGGDYYCAINDDLRKKITANTENLIEISENFAKKPAKSSKIMIQIRLQKPFVDIEKCTGCGICEHECPVSGKRAIRVSAEGETRSTDRPFQLKR